MSGAKQICAAAKTVASTTSTLACLVFLCGGCAPKTLITGAFLQKTAVRSGDVLAKIDDVPPRDQPPVVAAQSF